MIFSEKSMMLRACLCAVLLVQIASLSCLPYCPVWAKSKSATGLDQATLKLINQGKWQEAADRLKVLTSGKVDPSRRDAWLAFAYVYLNKCDDLAELSRRYDGQEEGQKDLSPVLVSIFSDVCSDKLKRAKETLSSLPDTASKDALASFAWAAYAAKKGNSKQAVDYCARSVELAPDFAWGYRTLGYLQDRWLKDSASADKSYQKALSVEPDCSGVRNLLVDLRLVNNDFDGAIDIAKAGIKSNSKNAGNYYRLAQIYIQQWRLREALEQLEKAVKLAPDDARFHRSIASILRHQGKLNEAIAEQSKAVELSKDKSFELVELAQLNILADNPNKAAENLKRALDLDPSNKGARKKLVELLRQEKQYTDLIAIYRKALKSQPKDGDLHFELARALNQSGKTDEAIGEFKKAANISASDPRPHRALGGIYIDREDYPAAAKEYTRALNINPNSADDLVALGYCYAQDDEFLKAEAALVTASALQQLTLPQDPVSQGKRLDVLRSLAVLLLAEGRYGDAATQLEAICASKFAGDKKNLDQFLLAQAKAARDRTGAKGKEMLAAFEKLSDEQKNEQQIAVIDTLLLMGKPELAMDALKKLPAEETDSDCQWQTAKSQALRLQGSLSGSKAAAEKAAGMDESDQKVLSGANLQLAETLLSSGEIEKADLAVRKAIELNPKSFAAYELSGRIYLLRKDKDKAIASGRRALELNPYYTRAYLLIGDAQVSGGDYKGASGNYEKAVELYPGLLKAHKLLYKAYKELDLKDKMKLEEETIAQLQKRK